MKIFNKKSEKNILKNNSENKDFHTIIIKNWYFKYGHSTKKQKWQLENINLKIHKGKWTTILGPNGSGKSTLAKSIVRINKSKQGEIFVDGIEASKIKAKEFAKKIAYIPQVVEIPSGTSVYDFVSFGRNPYLGITGSLSQKDKKIIKHAMIQTNIWDWKNDLLDAVSGGQRQKVLIAMIIAQDADIILLDEPTTYLDIRNQYELLEMMHNEHLKGKTIITILHDINQSVQYSEYIYMLKNGKIFAHGKPNDVITISNIKKVFNVEVELKEHNNRKFITDVQLPNFLNSLNLTNVKHPDKNLHAKSEFMPNKKNPKMS